MSEKQRVKRASLNSGLVKAAVVLMFVSCTSVPVSAVGPANETALRNAWALYNAQKYRESSDAFEAIIATSTPSARLYYYAALANRACNRTARARQLCQYIAANFPGAPESPYAQKLFPSSAPQVASSSSSLSSSSSSSSEAAFEVPEMFRGKSPEEVMKMPGGQEYLNKKIAMAESASKVSPMRGLTKGGKVGERVFTPADIAKDGANGIDQMYYPNCWFESSMSSLASLPRGQKLMADMVRYGPEEGSYVVRFPGDGQEYKITEEKLEKSGIHDKALWATLIECAQIMKFRARGGQLVEGLGALAGGKPMSMDPDSSSEQELSLFIDGAVKSQNPVVCGTHHYIPSGLPELVVTGHAYTIIGFEPSSGMVKIRNPHGANSTRFNLPNDPNHQKFHQLDDGVFKMHISLFKQYFVEVAKAHI